jgi:hypothetical protein
LAPVGAGCELGRREPVEARVRPVGVVVDPPFLDDLTSFVEICEQVFVQAFVAQPAVEAFNKTVLHRLAGRDVVPLDPELFLPSQHGVRGELGAIVADDHAWAAPSSVHLPLRIVCLLAGEQNPNLKSGAFQGSRSTHLQLNKFFSFNQHNIARNACCGNTHRDTHHTGGRRPYWPC